MLSFGQRLVVVRPQPLNGMPKSFGLRMKMSEAARSIAFVRNRVRLREVAAVILSEGVWFSQVLFWGFDGLGFTGLGLLSRVML